MSKIAKVIHASPADKHKPAARVASAAMLTLVTAACGTTAHAPRHESPTKRTSETPAAHQTPFTVPSTENTGRADGTVGSERPPKQDLCAAIPHDILDAILRKLTPLGRTETFTCDEGTGRAPDVSYLVYSGGDFAHFRAMDSAGAEMAVSIQSANTQGQDTLDAFRQNNFAEPLTVEGHPAAWARDHGILCVEAYQTLICTSMAGVGTMDEEKLLVQDIAKAVLRYGYE